MAIQLSNSKNIFNILFFISLLGGALYALNSFHDYMDIYEKGILFGSVGFFAWLGWSWDHFKKITILVFTISLFAIQIYNGVLANNQEIFLLKYLISSQSAIMWMNVFLSWRFYYIGWVYFQK